MIEVAAMPDSYRVKTVAPEWPREREDMGSKRKFWYTDNEGRDWLFKIPTSRTGEHWAEKIAAEIAATLRIAHARVELAQFDGQCGSTTESFTCNRRISMYHGNQLLAEIVNGYDPEKTFQNSSHTLENIWLTLDVIFCEESNQAKGIVAEYVVLDALIGNTDRHHENWALLHRQVEDRWMWSVAPSYDHASSLGRELLDKDRNKRLADQGIGRYSESRKARGGIYWSKNDRRAPGPLELVRRSCRRYPSLFTPALRKLEKLCDDTMTDVVNRVPEDWMAPSSRMFALELMRYNISELRKLRS